jgi:hypothetical protein
VITPQVIAFRRPPMVLVATVELPDANAGLEIVRDDLEAEAANELEAQGQAEQIREVWEALWPSRRS